jgi:membrane-bound metal-dependent hydrolase YbcI (DUF457 family)
MTDVTRRLGLVTGIGIGGVIVGFSPVFVLPAAVGAWLPDVDVGTEAFHRSWVLHTFVPTSVLYGVVTVSGLGDAYPFVLDTVHFLTLGMCAHFLLDYVHPREMAHAGSEWPIKPSIWSMPWGFLWLGIAWLYQWYFYLSRHFLPWLAGLGA